MLRYHGGKFRLAPWIISHFPKHRIYVEPFMGAASVLLQKPRAYSEVCNDLDGEIVNLFRVVRERGKEIKTLLENTPFAREEYADSFELSDDPIEQARRTFIRSYMGFGSNSLQRSVKSGFRSNSNRSGTTPAHDWANFPAALDAIIDRLRGVVIENRPAIDCIEAHDSAETLFYCDPPYVHDTRSTVSASGLAKGYAHEMTNQDHEAFADTVSSVKGIVMVSGYDCDLYKRLFRGWFTIQKETRADGALKRTECLWIRNFKPEADLFPS